MPTPTAIITYKGSRALAFLMVARGFGYSVPGDFSLGTFGRLHYGETKLTHCDQDWTTFGAQCADFLERRIEAGKPLPAEQCSMEFIAGSTAGPPRQTLI